MARKRRSKGKTKSSDWTACLKTCSMTPKTAKVPGNCAWCGTDLPRNKDGSIHKTRRWCKPKCSNDFSKNHYWSFARKAALRRDKNRCVDCSGVTRLQVHHIRPRKGRGYATGCHAHQSNLKTLCHKCHVAVTNEQRRSKPS